MNLLSTAGSCSDMESHAISAYEIGAFGNYVNFGAQRSLELLRAIDQTLIAVRSICDQMESFRRSLRALTDGIHLVKEPIPESEIIPIYGDVQDSLAKLYERMKQALASAKSDRELRPEDGVADIYRQAADQVSGLHDDIESFRWSLLNHNALVDGSPEGAVLSSPDEVDEFLSRL